MSQEPRTIRRELKTTDSFRKLIIWQLSHQLVIKVYSIIKKFPSFEKFILINQLIRAVISIPANIAEGYGRRSKKEFIQFLFISIGSLEETRYYIILSQELGYITQKEQEDLELLAIEIKAKTMSFIRHLQK